jgi:dihydrofolate synthase/folylpolyglutamate synthase
MSAKTRGNALPSLARLERLPMRGMRLGLAAIDEVCARLGRPERAVPSVLVAGTNGKGSCAATLSAIAGEAGIASGLYTSPHLESVTERVRIGRDDVSPEELDAALAEVFAAADRAPEVPVTYFEAATAGAFVAFARRRLELAVLEVGLGGRLDATNVSPASLSVVTSIGLDHVAELGPTVADIAREKAGVFRAGRRALVDGRLADALQAFRDAAARVGAELHDLFEEATISGADATVSGTWFRLRTPVREYELETPLPGAHQAANAAMAVRAAELLEPDFAVDAGAIARGVGSVRWPGRLERFLVRGRTVLLDGCHNPDGASALGLFLAETELEADLIFGAMGDKDVEGMAGVLAPMVRRIRLVPADGTDRAASPEDLRRRFAAFRDDAETSESLSAALAELLADDESETIIVAGSLYLVGEARSLLRSGRLGS